MPLSGTLDVTPLVDRAPLMPSLGTEPMDIEGAEVLYVMFEIDSQGMEGLIPPALNPTIPPVVTWIFYRCDDSPLGSFTLAQTRVGCRAGVRPRGFLTGAWVDDAAAGRALAERWGYRCETGEVTFDRRHHETLGLVRAGGETILDVRLVDAEPLAGTELLWTASMHLARVERDGSEQARLVQVDPEFGIKRADRGWPRLEVFEADAWGAEGVRPVYPVCASGATCDLHLPKIRYICDPNVAALQGTEKVG